jgi:phospholipid/cholesterol/gamma-HCH transport system ATP-binding protein
VAVAQGEKEHPVLIRVEGLAVGFDREPILEHLDFEVLRGQVFVILGGSGTGKSTLLQALFGLLPPLAGRVHIEGLGAPRVGDGPPRYGVMFQSGALFGSMTLAENLALPLRRWTALDEAGIEAVVRARLRLVDLDGFENHLPAELSGGMKKRAGIARALVLEPGLLFLDEPSAGLDPVNSVQLDELILTLNRELGVTVVLVSHELESVLHVADHCVMLDREARGIIARGNPRDLRDHAEDPRVRRFFHREAPPGAAAFPPATEGV